MGWEKELRIFSTLLSKNEAKSSAERVEGGGWRVRREDIVACILERFLAEASILWWKKEALAVVIVLENVDRRLW